MFARVTTNFENVLRQFSTYHSIDLAPEAIVQVSVIVDLTIRLGARFPVELTTTASEKR